jgi:hypothetical protein
VIVLHGQGTVGAPERVGGGGQESDSTSKATMAHSSGLRTTNTSTPSYPISQ